MFTAAALFYSNPAVAMWLGFIFAAYSAIANDSIQTIGTFIGSNAHRKWYVLWIFIGAIFLAVVTFSWLSNDGDVSFGRLKSVGADGNLLFPQPTSFNFLQVAAPIVLLIVTRLKMPVSTTFLLLSSFSMKAEGITKMLTKSLGGYVIAFVVAVLVFLLLNNIIKKYFRKREAHPAWTVAQWAISGCLWGVWIMQDAANIAVYLPRSLSLAEFLGFALTVFFGLGLIFYLKGDKIQQVVSEKTKISDVRAATLVDLSYSMILLYKLMDSTIPLSTTWVFLGLLGGREITINFLRRKAGQKHKYKAFMMAGNDVLKAFIGLIISVILAMGVNENIRTEIVGLFGF